MRIDAKSSDVMRAGRLDIAEGLGESDMILCRCRH